MEQPIVPWIMWFNQIGAEELEYGHFLEAAQLFELGLSLSHSPKSVAALPKAAAAQASPSSTVQNNETCADQHFLFGSAFRITAPGERRLEFSETDMCAQRAAAMLNLSISLHRAGLEAGIQGWISGAKATYQATLQFLRAVDQVHAIRIGICAYQNLAVLHYMQFEFDDCFKCLQSLYLMVQLGMDESILGETMLSQATMAMFFCAQPPTTAGCA